MTPPDNRPVPRFVADASRYGIPSGRFAERLSEVFSEACLAIGDLPAGTAAPEEVTWFPERTWSGRTWTPATALGTAVLEEGGELETIEFFGYVSYVQPDDGEGDPHDFQATADFTDVVAADNPDWQIDINDEVIGVWHGENRRQADITLVWGRSLVRDAYAATAEVMEVVVDQDPLFEDRFTLIAPDALRNYGDPEFLSVRLWTQRAVELAAESLYEEAGDGEDEESEPAEQPKPQT